MLSVMRRHGALQLLRVDLAVEAQVVERLLDRLFAGLVDLARDDDFLLDRRDFPVDDGAAHVLRSRHGARPGSTARARDRRRPILQ